MKMHRFIGDFDFMQEIIDLGSSDIAHQVTHVLRLKPGQEIILCNGQGKETKAKIIEMKKGMLVVQRGEIFSSIPEPTRAVTLYVALLKGEHFELIAEKATEVGVASLVPLITRRTVKLNFKWDRIQKIMKEAAEQSGRGSLPSISEPVSFQEGLLLAQAHEKNFFFDFSSPPFSEKMLQKTQSVGCFIGPEGGWDEKEREQAEKENFSIVTLGERVLRAETAAIVSAYLLCN